MTPITKREIPDGFKLDWDTTAWSIGFIFKWSEYYKQYISERAVTVKPNQSLLEAFESVMEGQMYPDYEIFFSA